MVITEMEAGSECGLFPGVSYSKHARHRVPEYEEGGPSTLEQQRFTGCWAGH